MLTVAQEEDEKRNMNTPKFKRLKRAVLKLFGPSPYKIPSQLRFPALFKAMTFEQLPDRGMAKQKSRGSNIFSAPAAKSIGV